MVCGEGRENGKKENGEGETQTRNFSGGSLEDFVKCYVLTKKAVETLYSLEIP